MICQKTTPPANTHQNKQAIILESSSLSVFKSPPVSFQKKNIVLWLMSYDFQYKLLSFPFNKLSSLIITNTSSNCVRFQRKFIQYTHIAHLMHTDIIDDILCERLFGFVTYSLEIQCIVSARKLQTTTKVC